MLVAGLVLAVVVSIVEFIYYARKNSARINKPLFTQMFEELRFAIKCGGSAKKIQEQNPAVLSFREELVRQTMKSNSISNLQQVQSNSTNSIAYERKKPPKERPKYQEKTLNNRESYLSSSNPGLLILSNEREAAMDAHNTLLSTHVLPHSSSVHSQQHKQLKHNHNYSKGPKKKSRHHHHHHHSHHSNSNHDKYNNEESDYILMRPISGCRSNHNINSRAHSNEPRSASSSQHNIPINIDAEVYYDHAANTYNDEQQVNFDRYLSKSQILKGQPMGSNSNSNGRLNRFI